MTWWEDFTDHVWIRIDMWLHTRHRRRTTNTRCRCGTTCWCSVRPELADDIHNPT